MRRTLTLAATSVLLWILVSQVNHALTGARVYIFVGGLFVIYAALTQPLRQGFAASFIAGLICDTSAPPSLFGTHAILFAAAHVTVFHMRDRLPRDDTTSRVVIALLTNLALFLVFSFSQIHLSPAPGVAWPRLLGDLVASQIFLTLVAPWYFAMQSRALVLTGVEQPALA